MPEITAEILIAKVNATYVKGQGRNNFCKYICYVVVAITPARVILSLSFPISHRSNDRGVDNGRFFFPSFS